MLGHKRRSVPQICKCMIYFIVCFYKDVLLFVGVRSSEKVCVESGSEEDGEVEFLTNQNPPSLNVQQVKITNHEGTMKLVYPSRADLQDSSYRVVRDYK